MHLYHYHFQRFWRIWSYGNGNGNGNSNGICHSCTQNTLAGLNPSSTCNRLSMHLYHGFHCIFTITITKCFGELGLMVMAPNPHSRRPQPSLNLQWAFNASLPWLSMKSYRCKGKPLPKNVGEPGLMVMPFLHPMHSRRPQPNPQPAIDFQCSWRNRPMQYSNRSDGIWF